MKTILNTYYLMSINLNNWNIIKMINNILFSLSHSNQVATITLNKPAIYNAFDLDMIIQLNQYITAASHEDNVKLIILNANGKHFSTGADLNWMQQSINYDINANLDDANQLASMLLNLYHVTKPVICAIQGNTYGGAIGIIACADLVIAANTANFCFSEVNLGLAPAIISQFVLKSMDNNFATYHMLTAKPFNAEQALNAGLVDELVPLNHLQKAITNNIEHLLSLNIESIITTKKLLKLQLNPISLEKLNECTKAIAELRTSPASQELIKQFLKSKK